MSFVIRHELPGDEDAIGEVTRQAFLTHPHSQQTESVVIDALREAGELAISLVAEQDGQIVGHIAFSPVLIDGVPLGWYGIGPVAVQPGLQGQGIGRALIEQGLARLGELDARGCVLVGEPAFYARFGFANTPDLVLDGVPQEFFLALPLGEASARGKVTFMPAFEAKGPTA